MTQKIKHFRPYITTEEIDLILSCLELKLPETEKLKGKFLTFKFKVMQELNTPAYSATPRVSLKESLGLESKAVKESKSEAEWKYLLQTYKTNPLLLSKESLYEVLARLFPSLTQEEIKKGKELEFELFGMDLGTFNSEEN